VHFHFGRVPTRLAGTDRVAEALLTPAGAAQARPEPLPAQLVLTAVGSRGRPVPGLPFDEESGIVPHTDGRVRADDAGREYVVGWIKRGPTGVIGTNRADALATVGTVIADLAGLPDGTGSARPFGGGELASAVDWTGWTGIDTTEVLRGADRGTARVKVATWGELLAAAHGGSRGLTAIEKG
jgi:ferredoxin--NADP+ reductase